MIKYILIYLISLNVFADVMEDFDSLGGNKVLVEKAQAIMPNAKVEIVQGRVVNRNKRHEFYPESGYVIGGETYIESGYFSGNYQFHINPHWSFGGKYSYFLNSLNREGEQLIELSDGEAEKLELPLIPDLNWQKQSFMLMANYYPIYGKMNVLGKGIVHFDLYALAGVGKVELRRNKANTYLAGIGMGMWFSQHLTSRIEIKYQNYKSEALTTSKNINLSSVSFSLGYLL